MDQSVPSTTTTKISQLAKRPKRSNTNLQKLGNPIDLVTNHFKVSFMNPKERIILYSVKIEPEIAADSRALLRKILTAAQGNIEGAGVKQPVFRGWNIWSHSKVDQPFTAQSILVDENQQYTVKISYAGEFNFEDIEARDNAQTTNPIVQTVNIAVKDSLRKLKYVELGRSSKYYDPRAFNDNIVAGGSINVWRGYKTSLHIFEQGLYLMIDFSSRVLRQETALQMIDYLWNKYKRKVDVKAEMVGLSVIANYGNHRIYRIDDIDFDSTPKSTFQLEKQGEISYLDYYKKFYNISIRDTTQPLLVNRDKRNPDKVYKLIPELMLMTGLTDQQRADYRLMKDVAQFTKLTPEQRNNDILNLRDDLIAPLKSHNIILDKEQGALGFQLYPPKIRLGKGKTLQNDSGFFIIKEPVLEPALINNWVLIYQRRGNQDDKDADFFLDQLQKSASYLGIQMKDPGFLTIPNDQPESWIQALKADFQKNGPPQVVVSLIPERSKGALYSALKEFLLFEKGVISQVVLTKFMAKPQKAGQIASKIAQQINAKLGNALWYVPVLPEVGQKTMLIGIDIYHKLVKGNQSCVGVVATVDPEFTKYWHKIIIMKKGQELIQELAGVIQDAIVVYFEQNGKKYLPENIIIYRDGVGDSQVQTLLNIELTSILNGFKNVSKKFEYKPNCAFIMINKKINHRFFAIGGGDQGGRGQSRGGKGGPRNQLVNPPSGTIMAEKIVTKNFDFFLSSQYVTEGTCTPTHFQVLYNTTDWSEETFWALTYHQCFNYWNWTGAVRVPACVQYAKKLAFLVGDTFKKSINDRLEIGLCFL